MTTTPYPKENLNENNKQGRKLPEEDAILKG